MSLLTDTGFDAMKQKYAGAAVRVVFYWAGVTLAGKNDDTMINEIAGALLVLLTAAWSLYEKRQSRAVTVTALALAKTSETDVKAMVASPMVDTPSVTTSPDAIPILSLADVERYTRPTG